jgi:hypothetical protein
MIRLAQDSAASGSIPRAQHCHVIGPFDTGASCTKIWVIHVAKARCQHVSRYALQLSVLKQACSFNSQEELAHESLFTSQSRSHLLKPLTKFQSAQDVLVVQSDCTTRRHPQTICSSATLPARPQWRGAGMERARTQSTHQPATKPASAHRTHPALSRDHALLLNEHGDTKNQHEIQRPWTGGPPIPIKRKHLGARFVMTLDTCNLVPHPMR